MSDPATHEADCVCAACLIRKFVIDAQKAEEERAALKGIPLQSGVFPRVITRVITDGISTKDGLS